MKKIPASLRIWFLAHFVIDIIFGFSLLLTPFWLLNLFGFETTDLFSARLVGAALLAIGFSSLLAYNKEIEVFQTLLTLKIIWSLAAILAIIISILESAPKSAYIILAIFIIFSSSWIYYKLKLNGS